jgi:hypothetical protein
VRQENCQQLLSPRNVFGLLEQCIKIYVLRKNPDLRNNKDRVLIFGFTDVWELQMQILEGFSGMVHSINRIIFHVKFICNGDKNIFFGCTCGSCLTFFGPG